MSRLLNFNSQRRLCGSRCLDELCVTIRFVRETAPGEDDDEQRAEDDCSIDQERSLLEHYWGGYREKLANQCIVRVARRVKKDRNQDASLCVVEDPRPEYGTGHCCQNKHTITG